jgi:integrase/recombinase XerD
LTAPRQPRDRALLMTVYGCGLRISEATQLKTSDIDRARMQLRVRNGKGQKCGATHFWPYVLVKFMLRWSRRCPPSEHLPDIDYT